jgi:hypothetical protein
MKKLYLDDVRVPIDKTWVVVKNYNEFIAKIRLIGLENIQLISLDHDLGRQAMQEYFNNVQNNYTLNYDNIINEKTGYDCAKFLVRHSMEKEIPLPKIQVHSANPIGSANIIGYINNYLKNCDLPQNCDRIIVPHTIHN